MSGTSPTSKVGFHDNGLKALSVAQLDASTRIRLAFHSEVRVLVMALLLDVVLDDFVRDVPRADAEVPGRPHAPPPELLAQVRELVHELVTIWSSRLIVTCGGSSRTGRRDPSRCA